MEKASHKNAAMKGTGKSNIAAVSVTRQSLRKMKNLEKEVELALSQEEEDKVNKGKVEVKVVLPSTEDKKQIYTTPKRRTVKVEPDAEFQTPRRSARKSVKPAQDYEDIVAKKTSCSIKKDGKQSSGDETEIGGSDDKSELQEIPDTPKWTPAKVGRGTQKRKKRKSRKTIGNQDGMDEERIGLEEEILIAIENDEDENKENVSPLDMLKQRKLSKDNENTKRSLELVNSSEKKWKSPRNTVLKPINLDHQANSLEKKVHAVKAKDENSTTEAKPLEPLGIQEQEFTLEVGEQGNAKTANTNKTEPKNSTTEVTVLEPSELQHQANTQERGEHGNTKTSIDSSATEFVVSNLINLVEELVVPLAPVTVQESKDSLLPSEQISQTINQNSNELVPVDIEQRKEPIPVDIEEINDSTFNASDCIMITPSSTPEKAAVNTEEAERGEPDCLMESLLLSDDEDENSNSQKVEAQNKNSEKLLPSIATIPKIIITNDTLSTPKQRPKPYRFPTPYKSREAKNLSFQFNEDMPDEDGEQANSNYTVPQSQSTVMTPASIMKFTNFEPKEIILRSIRKKRSVSLSTDRPHKLTHRVKFHSPANQTTFIEDIDLLITKSAKKRKVGTPAKLKQRDVAAPDTINVTKRRKRSISFDESYMRLRSKPQQGPRTPIKSQGTKIPNFAAIHQRHFNKMENLQDHLQRKAERAKILTTSTTKVRTASAQKVDQLTGASAQKVDQPTRAHKKIDLDHISVKTTAIKTTNDENPLQILDLPNPSLLLKTNMAIVKPLNSGKKNQQIPVVTSVKNVFKPTQEIQQKRTVTTAKPPFNLSTHVKTFNTSIMLNTGKSINQPISKVATVATRRQRHMDMFKSRKGGSALKDQENASEIIRGVRSNRRFELQMQHRKNLEHNTE